MTRLFAGWTRWTLSHSDYNFSLFSFFISFLCRVSLCGRLPRRWPCPRTLKTIRLRFLADFIWISSCFLDILKNFRWPCLRTLQTTLTWPSTTAPLSGQSRPSIMDISAGSGKSLINIAILAGIYQKSDIHLTYLHPSIGPLTIKLVISSVRSSLYYQRPSLRVSGRQMFHLVHTRVSQQSLLTVMMMLTMMMTMILMLVMMMML